MIRKIIVYDNIFYPLRKQIVEMHYMCEVRA